MPAKVLYRQLGKSGLRVSVPILGGMAFGSEKWRPWVLPTEKGVEVLKAAWDAGINTIDTANMYSNGESEKVIGQFISQHNIPRDQIVILTKVFCRINPTDPGSRVAFDPSAAQTKEYANDGGLSRIALFKQVDTSLRRLGTPYVDLLQIHAFDAATPIEETMRALHDLVVAGKVLYLGASNLKAWQLAEMNAVAERNGWTPFASVQVEHSLLYRPEEAEMFAYCKHKGIGVIAYSPLMDGHLARPLDTKTTRTEITSGSPLEKKRRESDRTIIRRVEELAGKKGVQMNQVALAWSSSKVVAPIVGANSTERVQQAVFDADLLSAEDTKYLEEPYEYQPTRN